MAREYRTPVQNHATHDDAFAGQVLRIVEGAEVRINSVLSVTGRPASSSGAPLPSWSGCRRLRPSEVFLLGQADGSFDGRYFGVTDADEILAPLALQAAIGGPQARN